MTPLASDFTFAALDLPARQDAAPSQPLDSEIETRPLFYPDRKPFEPARLPENEVEAEPAPPEFPEEEPVAAVERPPVKLLGTEHSSQRPAALVVMEESNDSTWVHEDDVISGWRVAKIAAETIDLVGENDQSSRVTLSLYPENR
ncbi:hypothetical protein [Pararhizobium gei]|uniref:hypothetical protein n=1 Tax=Pararhizobium gei TaxID=1395951 RepID=UPI0023DCE11C|nr:hypothetical protein [Rhizobium gei]